MYTLCLHSGCQGKYKLLINEIKGLFSFETTELIDFLSFLKSENIDFTLSINLLQKKTSNLLILVMWYFNNWQKLKYIFPNWEEL